MRLIEIASAEEQMALWKLINGSVWAAINQQARDEAESKVAAQGVAKLKGGKSKSKGATSSVRQPPPPSTKKVAPSPTQQMKSVGTPQNLLPRPAFSQQMAADPTQPMAAQKPLEPTLRQKPHF